MWFPISLCVFAFGGLLALRVFLSCNLNRYFDPLPNLSGETLQPLVAAAVSLIVLVASAYVVLSGSFIGSTMWTAGAVGVTVGYWLRPPNATALSLRG